MKYIKLFLISAVVFGIMLFCISLLFPSNTIVSRAVNVKKNPSLNLKELHQLSFGKITGSQQPSGTDTLVTISGFAAHIQEGVAQYHLSDDSTAIQVFYKIHVPAYKFWDKYGLMLNETKYGPPLDSAVKRIKENF